MKKIVALILALSMMFALSGCGKSEAVKQVEELIGSIGKVSMDSNETILEARSAFDTLTDKEQKQVENYSVLTDAESAFTDLCDNALLDAEKKIDNYDMEGAYRVLQTLPAEYSKEVESLTAKIDRLCYDNTFLVRAENIFSIAPATTEVTDQGGYRIYAYNFKSADSVSTVMSEYYKYLIQYYSTDDAASTSYDKISAQSYEFRTETGHVIKITSMSQIIFFVNVSIELNTDYRDTVQ